MRVRVPDVLMYTPTAGGGHARYTRQLVGAIASNRDKPQSVGVVTSHDLDPCCATDEYPILRILPRLKGRACFAHYPHWAISRLRHYASRDLGFARWLGQNADGCRLVHLQEFFPLTGPLFVSRLRSKGIRVVATVHNVRPHAYPVGVPPQLYDEAVRRTLRRCNGLVVHTAGLGSQLAAFIGTDCPPIFVAPHGVWTYTDATARLALDVPGQQHLLCFGVLRRNKGFEYLLKALQLTERAYRLTIAGVVEDRRYYEQLVELAACLPRDSVTFVPDYVSEETLVTLFRAASAVVLPYVDFAAQSGVLHDAVAHQVPIVASDVGGIGETVRRAGIGLAVPARNVGSLAAAIDAIHEADTHRRCTAALVAYSAVNGWDMAAAQTINAYQQVITAAA